VNYFSIDIDPSKSDMKDASLLKESARITRNTQNLFDITKLRVDSHRALLIPSFTLHYSKHLVDTLS